MLNGTNEDIFGITPVHLRAIFEVEQDRDNWDQADRRGPSHQYQSGGIGHIP